MQTLDKDMAKQTINDAKAEFTRAKDRLAKDLKTTKDDKINWSPSSTSRTPVECVAHAAMSIEGIQGMLTGKPFPFSGVDELDAFSRQEEAKFKSREQALGLLEEKSKGYLNWLDTLTPEQIGSTIELPFGSFPLAAAITFPADHLRCHAGQIEYIQTIYGDRDWHME